MANGLPHPQWNNGDVTDPAVVDLGVVRVDGAAFGGESSVDRPWLEP
ncbi:MAG: hypothetical protein QOH68_2044, partial [Nocardioidaceae bacterium]|nr:hypothetical protein [Nocardioidaceae bacterium]